MGDLFRADTSPCPQDKITIAVLATLHHCGLGYLNSTSKVVELCDVRSDYDLRSVPLPSHYYWTAVKLHDHEVAAIAELLEMVLAENPGGLPYSTVYVPDALDIHGKLRTNAGFTCATYVMAVFEAMSLPLIEADSWKSRPEDKAFKDSFLERAFFAPNRAIQSGRLDPLVARQQGMIASTSAMRIEFEEPAFRVTPGEVCGAATIEDYPANARQAGAAAKLVARRIKELEKSAPA